MLYLLRPLSNLYGFFADLRNRLFETRIIKSHQAVQYTISVGNLAVGGTGKTPMVEFLIRHLLQTCVQSDHKIATLSRGYGRQTSGFRLAQPTDTAQTIGDEPAQLYRKFGASITVCVGEKRVDALQQLHRLLPHIQTVILDDAFQHRLLRPHRNLLLTDYTRPFWTDYPFPEGRLRERRHGAARAQAVVVTKCPADLSPADQQQITTAVGRYAGLVPVFFAGLRYATPIGYAGGELTGPVVLVSGIANTTVLESYVRQTFGCVRYLSYGDHHAYTATDVARILNQTPPETSILTTEKDWVKLDILVTGADRSRFFYLPVAVYLLGNDTEFWQILAR